MTLPAFFPGSLPWAQANIFLNSWAVVESQVPHMHILFWTLENYKHLRKNKEKGGGRNTSKCSLWLLRWWNCRWFLFLDPYFPNFCLFSFLNLKHWGPVIRVSRDLHHCSKLSTKPPHFFYLIFALLSPTSGLLLSGGDDSFWSPLSMNPSPFHYWLRGTKQGRHELL